MRRLRSLGRLLRSLFGASSPLRQTAKANEGRGGLVPRSRRRKSCRLGSSRTAELPSIYNALQHEHRLRVISIYLHPNPDGTTLRPRVCCAAQQDGKHVIEGTCKHIRKTIDNHKTWGFCLNFTSPLEVFLYRETPAIGKLLSQRSFLRQHDTHRESTAGHCE